LTQISKKKTDNSIKLEENFPKKLDLIILRGQGVWGAGGSRGLGREEGQGDWGGDQEIRGGRGSGDLSLGRPICKGCNTGGGAPRAGNNAGHPTHL